METISSKEVKDRLSEILSQVAYGHKRFKIARHNKEMAIIISIEDWELIEKIIKQHEDEEDIREGEAALKEAEEKGSISFEEMKKRVGL